MRSWQSRASLLAGGAALLIAIPALSQDRRPESLLPPGFGDPQNLPPPEKATPTPRPPRQDTPRQTPDQQNLPANTTIEYKYVKKNGSTVTWESGANRTLNTGSACTTSVADSWK